MSISKIPALESLECVGRQNFEQIKRTNHRGKICEHVQLNGFQSNKHHHIIIEEKIHKMSNRFWHDVRQAEASEEV
jgi:hypothetical protein